MFTYTYGDSDLLRFSLPICFCPLLFAYGMESIEWRKKPRAMNIYIYGKANTYIYTHFNATTMKCLIKISWPQRQQQQQWTITFTIWRNVSLWVMLWSQVCYCRFFNVLALQALTARYLCKFILYFCERLELVCAGGSIDWFWNVIPLRGFFFFFRFYWFRVRVIGSREDFIAGFSVVVAENL